MLKSKKDVQEFIKMLFDSKEIEINGIIASNKDLIYLCERVRSGKENIKAQKQYISAGQIKKICVQTF